MDARNIILETYKEYKETMLAFQEQHGLIFGDKSKACDVILKNVGGFVDVVIQRINEEHEKERKDKSFPKTDGSDGNS